MVNASIKSRLDPELIAGYDLIEALHLLDDIRPDTIPRTRVALRDAFLALRAKLPKIETVTFADHELASGDAKIRARVYRKSGAPVPAPCLYWIHGGGMIMGSIEADDVVCSIFADRLDCTVVSIDYRLAPEFPNPIPVEDCYAGLRWAAEQAASLGIDSSRLVIAGSSAGAGLAAGTALLARDRGGPVIAFQCLAYPMLDDRNETASAKEFDAIATWSGKSNRTGWAALLGGGEPSIYAAPARATNLAGLPPALIQVGELEVFRDEDIDYATRLMQAGVPVELHVYPGAVHAWESLAPGSRVGKKMIADRLSALNHALRVR